MLFKFIFISDKPVSETTIACITGALAVLVLILLPIDYVLSKRRIRRQKLWERRATKKKRNERVAAFNMIAIKHAGNLSRPPLVLMQARDMSLNPIPIPDKLYPYTDNAQENTTAEQREYQRHISFAEDIKSKEETEMHKETGFIENGNLGAPCGNPRVLPPLERKPSKRKKKKKKRRITPQSSMDANDGGFFNAAYSNSNPNLDHIGQDIYENEFHDKHTLKPPEGGTEHQHRVDVHRENDYQTILNSDAIGNHTDEVPRQNGTHDSIALQVGYNSLGDLATDV